MTHSYCAPRPPTGECAMCVTEERDRYKAALTEIAGKAIHSDPEEFMKCPEIAEKALHPCAECKGTGEIGLADGDVVCPKCYGSGNPAHPGVFKPPS